MQDDNPRLEPTLIEAITRFWWLVALLTVGGAALAIAAAQLSATGAFTAETAMVVADPRATGLFEGSIIRTSDYVADQVNVLGSGELARRSSEEAASIDQNFPYDTIEMLDRITVVDPGDSSVITIRFEADTADWAVLGANAVSAAYQSFLSSEALGAFASSVQVLDDEIAELEEEIDLIQDGIESEQTQAGLSSAGLLTKLEEVLPELLSLYDRLSITTSAETQETIRAEIEDIRALVGTAQVLDGIEGVSPELTELTLRLSQLVQRVDGLSERRDNIRVDSELLGSGVRLTTPALIATEVAPPLRRYLVVGLFLGLVSGAAIAFFLAMRNRRVTDSAQPAIVLEAPLVAAIPDFAIENIRHPIPVIEAPRSASAEAFRFAAAVLDLWGVEVEGGIIVGITSPNRGAGKTVNALNVAAAAAREGKRVLLIDSDFGSLEATRRLGIDASSVVGITEAGVGAANLVDAIVSGSAGDVVVPDLLTRGQLPVTAPAFFRQASTRKLFNDLRDRYDLIVVDMPPMLTVAYANTIAGIVDRVVVVVPHGSQAIELEQLAEQLRLIGVDVGGYVYNKSAIRFQRVGMDGSLKDVLGGPPPMSGPGGR